MATRGGDIERVRSKLEAKAEKDVCVLLKPIDGSQSIWFSKNLHINGLKFQL